ncbi:hypothetical protein Leryth_024276, partial [Lithospermum erythrorhizon]
MNSYKPGQRYGLTCPLVCVFTLFDAFLFNRWMG